MLSGLFPLPRTRAAALCVAGFVLVLSVMALALLGRSIVEFVYFPAAAVLILAGFDWKRLQRPDLLFAALALAPFAAFALANFVQTETYGLERRVESDPYFWLEYGATSTVLVLGALCARGLDRAARLALPLGLAIIFIGLTLYFYAFELPEDCRVRARSGSPFAPALVTSSFALLYFVIAPRFSRAELWLSGLFLTTTVIITLGYTAARGMFLGLMAALVLIVAVLLICRQGPWRAQLGMIFAALLIGGAASVAVLESSACSNGLLRYLAIVNPDLDPAREVVVVVEPAAPAVAPDTSPPAAAPLQPPQPAPAEAETSLKTYNSVTLRLFLWGEALGLIAQDPLLGAGRHAEIQQMSSSGHDHAHQQYLSWLIWFGIPGLLAGMAGLFAPIVALRALPALQDRLLLLVASCSILPVALLFDTLMRLKQVIVFQVLFSAVAYVIIKELRARAPSPTCTKPRKLN